MRGDVMDTLTPEQFIARVEQTEVEATKKNVLVAVRRVLKDLDPSFPFTFDARGVQILFEMFEAAEQRSSTPLSKRAMDNYKNLFLHAAHMCAATPVQKRYKVLMTLDID